MTYLFSKCWGEHRERQAQWPVQPTHSRLSIRCLESHINVVPALHRQRVRAVSPCLSPRCFAPMGIPTDKGFSCNFPTMHSWSQEVLAQSETEEMAQTRMNTAYAVAPGTQLLAAFVREL